MQTFLLSVITVVKNDEKNIENTIKSIISQKNVNLEYIVIDGFSTDNTLSIVKKYSKFISKIISEEDLGIYDAMNKGINIVNGDIVVFCNSGDFFYENSLEKVIKIFKKNTCDFVFGTVLRNYSPGQILKYKYNPKRIYYNFDFATSHSTGFFLKKKVYDQIGLYSNKFKCSADYDFYFRLIKNNYKGTVTSKDTLIGNVASGGYSSTFSYLGHLIEETKIRLHNKQNFFMVMLIFLNTIIKYPLKFFKAKNFF